MPLLKTLTLTTLVIAGSTLLIYTHNRDKREPLVDPQAAQLQQRPLRLPIVRAGERCPVSQGSHESVPRVDYIFCSTCYWFGKGPAYFALSFQDGHTTEATFDLKTVPFENSAYRAKTPWVSRPDYSRSDRR